MINLNNTTRRFVYKSRLVLFGNREESGILVKFIIYFFLINIVLIYLAPIIQMISSSMKGIEDMLDSSVNLIPRHPTFLNFKLAFKELKYWEGMEKTLILVLPSAIMQVVACGIAGYAFGRLTFPGKKILFVLLIFAFIIPPETIVVPMFILYKNFKFMNTPLPYIIPAIFGHGIKAPLFVIIYTQYFKTQPHEIEDAARIDGAGALKTFWRVMFPMAKPAMIVVFLFSVIWHWNETFQYNMFSSRWRTLGMRLGDLASLITDTATWDGFVKKVAGQGASLGIGETTFMMAGCLLIILPTVILFFAAQKWFTQGIERTGLVE